MPLKLNLDNVKKYAQVDPAFVDLLVEAWKARWKTMNNDIKVQNPRFRDIKAQSNAPIMNRLKLLCTDKAALDKEITRLRGLPFERFYVREYNRTKWFVGLTPPVVMNDDTFIYQAPRYFVYIPEDVRGTESPLHFVPEGHEMTWARHPHHNIGGLSYQYASTKEELRLIYQDARDPLDYKPSTCWGSFGQIATSCTKAGDIVDLFRNLGIYLSRINQSSLLTRPFTDCIFLEKIGPAPEPKEAAITKKTRFYDR